MLPAGVFLLILVGWAEEQERRSQRRPRKTIMLVSMQEIGTVTTPNIIRAKQATQKKACAKLMPGAASIIRARREASIMSIIGGSVLRSRASRNTPFSCQKRRGVRSVGKMQLQVQSSSGNRHRLTEFLGPFPHTPVATFG